MSEQELNSYRFLSGQVPTDEIAFCDNNSEISASKVLLTGRFISNHPDIISNIKGLAP